MRHLTNTFYLVGELKIPPAVWDLGSETILRQKNFMKQVPENVGGGNKRKQKGKGEGSFN